MNQPYLTLNDGHRIPQLGFGMWKIGDNEAPALVDHAIKSGYRSIDSAQIYENEAGLGRAIAESPVKREELFITTKIWNSEQGFDSTMKSFEVSMQKLKLDYLDLLLIHWPSAFRNLYAETWKALIELQKQKRVRTIGVSNFMPENLEKIIHESGVVPAINQIELHPKFQQKELQAIHARYNIQTEAWSPLGQGTLLSEPVILSMARKHGKSSAQIILRWHIQKNFVVIPKSSTPTRIFENFQIFDFELDASDMDLMEKMDDPMGRVGPNPQTATF
jgi:2,5-diketo-D-gluconate reductase A